MNKLITVEAMYSSKKKGEKRATLLIMPLDPVAREVFVELSKRLVVEEEDHTHFSIIMTFHADQSWEEVKRAVSDKITLWQRIIVGKIQHETPPETETFQVTTTGISLNE